MKVFRKLLKNFNHEGSTEEHKPAYVSRAHTSFEGNDIACSNASIKSSKFHLAVLSGREAEVKKYITKRNINEQDGSNRTALHLAVLQNSPSIVKLLLSHGASVEICDRTGFTPFLRAVEMGSTDLVKIFWDRKLNKTQTDFNGNTALHLAVTYGFYNIVCLIVKNSTLVNIPNEAGEYPLHTATQNESFSIAKILLENHARVDVEDKMKRTPLLIAVKIGNLSLVELYLNYKADGTRCDINGISIKEYATSCKNPNIGRLINEDQPEPSKSAVINRIQANDEDSQTSEQSCVLPPILEAPKSWNMLHPNNLEDKKLYRRNVKSLSSGFPEDSRRNELSEDRRNSFSSFQQIDGNSKQTFSKEDEGSQYEDCRKVLDELSLDNLHKCDELKSEDKQVKSLKFDIYPKFKKPLISSECTTREKIEKKQKIFFKKHTFAENHSDFDSSSDEDPPFWKNSLDGGYFTGDPSHDNKNEAAMTNYNSSSSEENLDSEDCVNSNNVVLNRLKEVTQENQDLETESAVLREAAEKLKYDLANCRLVTDLKETNLNQIKAQMLQLDSKYLKAVQKINSFHLSMRNLEQEVVHLKNICDRTNETNIQESVAVDHQNEIRKLQADVLYWKTKYQEVVDRPEENLTNFNMQNLVALNLELNKLNGRIKDCLSKADFEELQNQNEILTGKMMHKILDEANQRLQSSIAGIKCDIESKLNEKVSSHSDVHIREMEHENMKQKFLLEISKLTALVKEKECNEQRLKNQLSDCRNEVQKLKNEKRKSLIKMAFEGPTSLQTTRTNLPGISSNSSHTSHEILDNRT